MSSDSMQLLLIFAIVLFPDIKEVTLIANFFPIVVVKLFEKNRCFRKFISNQFLS